MHGHVLNYLNTSQKGSCQEGRKPGVGVGFPSSQLEYGERPVVPSDVLPQTRVGLTRICLMAKSKDSDLVALLAFLRT